MILFRYLAGHFFRSFATIVVFFAGLFLLLDGAEQMRRFARYSSTSWPDLLLLIGLRLPDFILRFLPPILLLATLLAVTRLSHNNEITAMRAGGIPLRRILLSFLIAGGVVTLSQGLLLNHVIPVTALVSSQMMERMKQGQSAMQPVGELFSTSHDRDLWLRDRDWIIHAEQAVAQQGVLFDVMIFQFDNDLLRTRIDARKAEFRDGSWSLVDGTSYQFGAVMKAQKFTAMPWQSQLDMAQLNRSTPAPAHLSFSQLRRYADRLQREGYDAVLYQLARQRRMADPVTTLASVLLAFPFAVRLHRMGKVRRSLATGVAVGFVLYIIVDLFNSFGEHHRLTPELAAWSPVAMFTGFAAFLLLHLED
ncbi:MAG: LPS export ABC transporter permease LptG [Magnetococcales bacterium]|nr:LPS export ABC transporter permease LptG [Magnetococcales bacterium]